jgi:hypothetical protein
MGMGIAGHRCIGCRHSRGARVDVVQDVVDTRDGSVSGGKSGVGGDVRRVSRKESVKNRRVDSNGGVGFGLKPGRIKCGTSRDGGSDRRCPR